MLSRISGLREREFACRYVRYLLPNHIRFRIGSENCHWPQKTRGHIRSLVYRLFEKAMLWKLIPLERKSMTLVELKGVSKRLKPPRILTEEKFGALLNQFDHPYRCMVLLAGCTGLRISEVMGLRWNLMDFESLVMEIREGYARSQVTMLKSECSKDELPLDPEVATILMKWKPLCPDTWRLGFFQTADKQTLRFWFGSEESAPDCSVAGQDSGTERLAHAASQLPRLARRGRRPSRRSTETHASRQHLDHDERRIAFESASRLAAGAGETISSEHRSAMINPKFQQMAPEAAGEARDSKRLA